MIPAAIRLIETTRLHNPNPPHKLATDPKKVPVGLPAAEHAHGVLAMRTGYRDELVQDAPLLGPPAVAVSLDDRRHEFIPRRHAHPPHSYLPDPIRVGSISDEATAQHSGTFLTRQCALS